MNNLLVRMIGLLKELTPQVLALSLVLMPFGEAACASPCGPGEPAGGHGCALHVSRTALPVPAAAACCTAGFMEASQYLTRRQKPEESGNRLWNMAAVQVLLKEPALSISGGSLKLSPSPSTLPPFHPLYVLHAAFLN